MKAAEIAPKTFFEELKAGDVAPVYCLVGPEAFLIGRAVDLLKEELLSGGFADMNLLSVLAREARPETVIDACLTAPAFAKRRLAIVRDALPPLKDAEEAYVRYLADPAPTTTLVLTGEKIDARTKLYGLALEKGRVVRFEKLEARELAPWVAREARRAGVRLAPGAFETLVDLLGADLGLLVRELEKLRLLVGEGGEVTSAEVESLAADVRETGIFDLIRAVERRRADEALRCWSRLSKDQGAVPYVVSMLAGQFRRIWQARVLLDSGVRPEEVGKRLKLYGYAAKAVAEQARAWKRTDLESVGRRLLEVDILSKSSRVPADLHMEALLLDLAGR